MRGTLDSFDAIARAIFAGLALALLSGCISGTSRTPELTENPLEGFRPTGLSSGDILDVVFFRTGRSAQSEYRIQPGDQIRVDVFGHPDLSQARVLVLPDGRVALNGVPEVLATGLTPRELGTQLRSIYQSRQIRDPIVSVSLTEADIRVGSLTRLGNDNQGRFILEVSEGDPIDLPYIDPVPLPPTLKALQDEVQSAYDEVFEGSIEVTVNLRNRLDPRIFVLGQVETGGPVPYRAPMTAFMAIASAGGFAPTANSSEVRLVRLGDDGRVITKRLQLREGQVGPFRTQNDIVLQDNDIIYVPMSGVAVTNQRVEQWIRNMLPTAVGFGLAYDVN